MTDQLPRRNKAGAAKRGTQITWRTIAYVFLPIIFITLGGAGIHNAVQEVRESSYISVEGKSLGAEILLIRERTRDTPARSGSGNRWLLEVTYQYEIDGQRYENKRFGLKEHITPAEDMNPPTWLKDLAAAYAAGQHINVWVSPDNPSVKPALVRTTGTWIAPILIALASLAAFWLTWKTARRPKAD